MKTIRSFLLFIAYLFAFHYLGLLIANLTMNIWFQHYISINASNLIATIFILPAAILSYPFSGMLMQFNLIEGDLIRLPSLLGILIVYIIYFVSILAIRYLLGFALAIKK